MSSTPSPGQIRAVTASSGLTGAETVAHFHGFSPPGSPSGPLHTLPPGSPKIGTWNYAEPQEAMILDGLVYINIHSTTAPPGEIRGQVVQAPISYCGCEKAATTSSSPTAAAR